MKHQGYEDFIVRPDTHAGRAHLAAMDPADVAAARERVAVKRDLRRRLPDAARPLVTLADRLDDIAADVRSGWQYPEHSAERLSTAADTIRRALADLADDTDR